MSIPPFAINLERLGAEIDELAAITEVEPPAVTRILFSDHDLQARAWLRRKCEEAGLACRTDGIGNFYARWTGTDPSLPAVATGSHIDAIPNAGRYDGVLGVLGGLEAFRSLREAGFVPRRSLELIAFTSEEPTRFGIGCLGSRLMSGVLSADQALALRDQEGAGLADWMRKGGCDPAGLGGVRLRPGVYRAFVELHIEQGPILEREGLDIGVVEKIAAPSSFRLDLEGEGGHAGGVLMPGRRDALLAGAEIALAVEKAALGSGSPDTVATTGVLQVRPGAINSIPFHAHLEVDLRDTDVVARRRALDAIRAAVEEVGARRNIGHRWEQINLDPPALAEPTLVAAALAGAERHGFSTRRMVSRAYHDSLFMAQLCPITMIFIPCRGGVSHRPDEYSSPEQIRRGVTTLAEALRETAQA